MQKDTFNSLSYLNTNSIWPVFPSQNTLNLRLAKQPYLFPFFSCFSHCFFPVSLTDLSSTYPLNAGIFISLQIKSLGYSFLQVHFIYKQSKGSLVQIHLLSFRSINSTDNWLVSFSSNRYFKFNTIKPEPKISPTDLKLTLPLGFVHSWPRTKAGVTLASSFSHQILCLKYF